MSRSFIRIVEKLAYEFHNMLAQEKDRVNNREMQGKMQIVRTNNVLILI